MKRKKDYFRGCLIGGAIGDAMGWPVEFLSLEDIKSKYGKGGIQDIKLSPKGIWEITDDTQMTLFTAEGILLAETCEKEEVICDRATFVYHSYLRWLHTQGYEKLSSMDWIYEGRLLKIRELYAKRAPGMSCLSALASGKQGTVEQPINDSKGCGGVMRVSPIGLLYPKKKAFQIAVECAAITHGHPLGYLPAGAFAYIIAGIIEGTELESIITEVLNELKNFEGHKGCSKLLQKAMDLAKSETDPVEAISDIGEGWVGEEALAIAVYCALKYKNDFKKAIFSAVNHNGDSDSTGSITGNILGAYLGVKGIPEEWKEAVELSEVINSIADDLIINDMR